MKRVAIIGGGISGLATAYYLRRARPDLPLTLIERRERLGGVMTTLHQEGFLIEGGPDSFITAKPWALQLCRDLGLENQLIPTTPENRKVYVLSGGSLKPLPVGTFLTVPTQMGPLLRSNLISLPGKMRMAMEVFVPKGDEQEDESIGSFVRRRLGQEAVDKIAEPIMAGIFVAEADRLSMRSTFPRFLELERQHGSLIRAMRKAPASGGSPFLTLQGGMQGLVDAIEKAIAGVSIRTGTAVRGIEPPLKVVTEQETISADAVVLAVPPPECASILRSRLPELADHVAAIPTVATATVSLGYKAPPVSTALDATGFVIARGEQRRILACTWSSKKFEGRAPKDHLLVRCFMGGSKDEARLKEDDTGLLRIAREELRDIMGLQGEPVVSAVFRWPGANPIYEVGHEKRVQAIESLAATIPNLYLCGSGFRGVGIPDCVHEAQRTAERILA